MSRTSIDQLNAAADASFAAALDGLYDGAPWLAPAVAAERPFASEAALRQAFVRRVRGVDDATQRALLRAHRPRPGSAPADPGLEAARAAYEARFGFPFVLAGVGHDGTERGAAETQATLAWRRLRSVEAERAEALRQLHREAERRLHALLGTVPARGRQLLAWAGALAAHSDPGFKERGELTVTYLRDAHRACSAQLRQWMTVDAGFDEVEEDALGNLVGLYHAQGAADGRAAPRLLIGSHFDTVRNAGRFDGRLGILAAMLAVQALARQGRRLPFAVELVAIAEEEGQRFQAGGFLGASALVGEFDPAWLDATDADGVRLADALRSAGLDPAAIPALRRERSRYLGYVELHIEQGPVLAAADLPLGVVSAINGAVRLGLEIDGAACHAGTTPMADRHDAAAAAAEVVLAVERLASAAPGVVGTVGMLEVPGGSINVVPGRCRLSIDLRAPSDDRRDATLAALQAETAAIAGRRGVTIRQAETMRVAASPCDESGQRHWAAAVASLGLPVFSLPSGAGHDAMVLGRRMPQSMLFVRGQHDGISHSPLEAVTDDDAELAVAALLALLDRLATPAAG